jgi:small subunit ribosomal protein S17e
MKLGLDFDYNKLILKDVAKVQSKRLRNKIAGYATHLMKRIENGQTIRGVSLKVQEEEREKRLEEAPEKSAVDISQVIVSAGTKAMLEYPFLMLPFL